MRACQLPAQLLLCTTESRFKRLAVQPMMKLEEKIDLPNGLIMEIWDDSRPVADDTIRVTLIIRIPVEVRPEYFPQLQQYEDARKVFGAEVVFEYKKERSFIHSETRQSTFAELLDAFKRNSLSYIMKPNFPSRFVFSRYRDFLKNPRKYQPA